MSKGHLQKYFTEFGYRYNTRTLTAVERFEDAVSQISSTRLTYNKLIGKKEWQYKDGNDIASKLEGKTGYEHLDNLDIESF
jgi:hypothetical protein